MAASASSDLLDVDGENASSLRAFSISNHQSSSSSIAKGSGSDGTGDNDLGVSIYDQTIRNNSSPLSQNDELGIALNMSTGSIGPSETDSKDSRSNSENQFSFKLDQKDFDESEIEREQQEQLKKESAAGELVPETSGEEVEEEEQEPIELNEEWQKKPKHIFILSEAGKPIYSLWVNLSSLPFYFYLSSRFRGN